MAYSNLSQLRMLAGEAGATVRWGKKAIEMARELGDRATEMHALNNVGTARLFADRGGGRELLEESLALSLEHGFHEHAARVYTNLSEYAVVFKDFALAQRVLAEYPKVEMPLRDDSTAPDAFYKPQRLEKGARSPRMPRFAELAEGLLFELRHPGRKAVNPARSRPRAASRARAASPAFRVAASAALGG